MSQARQSGSSEPSDESAGEQASGSVPKDAQPKRKINYTLTAREGVDVAELVKAAFGRKTYGAQTPRRVEVIAPDGPSTAGGKRARQTVRLVAAAGEAAPVMCGFVDAAQKRVELRTYASVSRQFEERFGAPFDVTEPEYGALCRELEATLSAFRYAFAYESDDQAARGERLRTQQSASDAPRARPLLNVVLVVVLSAIVAGVVLAIIQR